MPAEIHSQKKQLRLSIRRQRLKLTSEHHQQYSSQIFNRIVAEKSLLNCKNIAIFLSQDGEPCTQSIIDYCWQQGIHTFVPVIALDHSNKMTFMEYHKHATLHRNRFGIPEPLSEKSILEENIKLDIVFMPLVAFSEEGARLGMGGGYYDRFLESYIKTNTDLKLMGLAYEFQKRDKLPTESWDMGLSGVVTEEQFYLF